MFSFYDKVDVDEEPYLLRLGYTFVYLLYNFIKGSVWMFTYYCIGNTVWPRATRSLLTNIAWSVLEVYTSFQLKGNAFIEEHQGWLLPYVPYFPQMASAVGLTVPSNGTANQDKDIAAKDSPFKSMDEVFYINDEGRFATEADEWSFMMCTSSKVNAVRICPRGNTTIGDGTSDETPIASDNENNAVEEQQGSGRIRSASDAECANYRFLSCILNRYDKFDETNKSKQQMLEFNLQGMTGVSGWNFYVLGNVLFTRPFIRFYIRHCADIADPEALSKMLLVIDSGHYSVDIIDDKVNILSVGPSQTLSITRDKAVVCDKNQ